MVDSLSRVKGGFTALAVALAAVICVCSSSARTPSVPMFTLFGDSVADAMQLDNSAVGILKAGDVVNFQVAPCRRLEGAGCPYQGSLPASAVQVIIALGSKVGPNVVMDIGYNDFETQYAGNITDALAAMKAVGVKHVWWVTLRASRHPYITMNANIATAAAETSWMSVIDWNAYSRNHTEWFQSDGVHLLHTGAIAMATLIHQSLVAAGASAPPVKIATTNLPAAHRDRPYRTRLRTLSGTAPFGWTLLERAPRGIHLLVNGTVDGTPTAKPGRYAFNVEVRDAAGFLATRRLTLRIE
jgi:hypothetical protein